MRTVLVSCCATFDGRYCVDCMRGSPDLSGWLFWWTWALAGLAWSLWPLLRSVANWIQTVWDAELMGVLVLFAVGWLALWCDVVGVPSGNYHYRERDQEPPEP